MSKDDNLAAFPDQKAIDAAAADWLLRFEEGELSAEEYAEFLAWRTENPRHSQAFVRLS